MASTAIPEIDYKWIVLAFCLHRLNCAFRSANLVFNDNRPNVVIELNLF